MHELRCDRRGAPGDVVLLVEVRDVDVAGCGTGGEREDSKEEEAVIDGDLASLNDANIHSTDSEGGGDSKKDTNARLHPISWYVVCVQDKTGRTLEPTSEMRTDDVCMIDR